MTLEPNERQTAIATLVRVRPDYLEARYQSGCLLSTAGVNEVQVARRDLMGNTPYAMLSIIPEDADFELAAVNVDHLAEDRRDGLMIAIAVVARANMLQMILKLYFSYFPQMNRILVTDREPEARAWLDVQFKEMGLTGS
ncbi:MAG: hypothetical protein ABI599_07960 [Flavobacteriales bacterium]